MRRGFAPHFQHPKKEKKNDQIYHFIQILLGPVLNFDWRTPNDFFFFFLTSAPDNSSTSITWEVMEERSSTASSSREARHGNTQYLQPKNAVHKLHVLPRRIREEIWRSWSRDLGGHMTGVWWELPRIFSVFCVNFPNYRHFGGNAFVNFNEIKILNDSQLTDGLMPCQGLYFCVSEGYINCYKHTCAGVK